MDGLKGYGLAGGCCKEWAVEKGEEFILGCVHIGQLFRQVKNASS